MTIRVPGWPSHFIDPTELKLPRLGRLALGRFVVENRLTFVYERYNPEVVRLDGRKTFLVIPMGGVEGKLLEVTANQPLNWEPSKFDHVRYQAILRKQSLKEWWIEQGPPDVAKWLYTAADGTLLSLEDYRLPDLDQFPIEMG